MVGQKAFGGGVYGCRAAWGDELQTARTIHNFSLGGVGHDGGKAGVDIIRAESCGCNSAQTGCPSGQVCQNGMCDCEKCEFHGLIRPYASGTALQIGCSLFRECPVLIEHKESFGP